MKHLKLRHPSGLETPTHNGPYFHHNTVDNCCQDLDKEELDYNCSNWEHNLRFEMRTECFVWLRRRYPELLFQWSKQRPKNKDKSLFIEERGGGFIIAGWKTAEESRKEEIKF